MLDSRSIGDHDRSILIPVVGLSSSDVVNFSFIDPRFGLEVLGVINLLRRVDSRVKVFQQATLPDGLVVDENLKGLIRASPGVSKRRLEHSSRGKDNLLGDQGVKGGGLSDLRGRRVLQVLLFPFTGERVLVSEDEVNLVGGTTFVGTEHDGEGGLQMT